MLRLKEIGISIRGDSIESREVGPWGIARIINQFLQMVAMFCVETIVRWKKWIHSLLWWFVVSYEMEGDKLNIQHSSY